jgi:hypothetical protein
MTVKSIKHIYKKPCLNTGERRDEFGHCPRKNDRKAVQRVIPVRPPGPSPGPGPRPPTPPKPPSKKSKSSKSGLSAGDVAAITAGVAGAGAIAAGSSLVAGAGGASTSADVAYSALPVEEDIEMGVLSRQAETTALLGEDETGAMVDVDLEAGEAATELTPLVEAGAEEAAVAGGEVAADVAVGAGIAATEGAELATAAALAPETLGTSLIVGGVVMAGTAATAEVVQNADKIEDAAESAYNTTKKAANNAAKATKHFFHNVF